MKEIDEINSVKRTTQVFRKTVRGGIMCGAERYRTDQIQCDENYK
jgi:hypothetical protein